MSVVGAKKKWHSKSKSTKPTNYSVDGLNYETITHAKDVAKSIKKKVPKGLTVHTLKAGRKKIPDLSHLTVMPFAQVVTRGSTKTPTSTNYGKYPKKDKRLLTISSWQAIPTRKRIGLPRNFTGLKNWLIKPIFSIKDLLIVLLLVKLIWFLSEHLVWK